MNTSKQVNVMIGLLFVTFIILSAYLVNESNRQDVESAEITERNAERGARLFVQNCRTCHGLEGEGAIGAAVNSDAFLVLEEGNAYGIPATPDAEAAAIRSYLRQTIECGRPGTYMQAWSQRYGGSLSDTQINHLVTLITNDPSGKHDFWDDLVVVEGDHADEEQFGAVLEQELGRHPTIAEVRERSQAETVVLDPSALTVNTESCGTYRPETKTAFRNRDPFSDAPPVVATPEPDDEDAAPAPPVGDGEGVAVLMTEWDMETEATIAAGTITFQVRNDGAVAHEFAVVRSDLPADGLPIDGAVADETGLEVLGRIPEFGAGSSQAITLDLTPGNYLLICNVPAHYTLGMATAITVE